MFVFGRRNVASVLCHSSTPASSSSRVGSRGSASAPPGALSHTSPKSVGMNGFGSGSRSIPPSALAASQRSRVSSEMRAVPKGVLYHGSRYGAAAATQREEWRVMTRAGVSKASIASMAAGSNSWCRYGAESTSAGGWCSSEVASEFAASIGSSCSLYRNPISASEEHSSNTHRAGGKARSMLTAAKSSSRISFTLPSPSSDRAICTSNIAKSEAETDSPAQSESTQPRPLRSERSDPSLSCPRRCEMYRCGFERHSCRIGGIGHMTVSRRSCRTGTLTSARRMDDA
mmetsp:Transcript_13973/g.44850  ORF Transcript_13973/g.44850 Transcript_13973/m.44850 type:complete len:287 (+) Transcript_13973:1500-2360(+)